MKSVLYYFTGTGNSLTAAAFLAECLTGDVALLPISRTQREKRIRIDADMLGIVFPVYFGTVPEIVETFLSKLEFEESPYIFALATCNGKPLFTGDALKLCLQRAGQALSYFDSVNMPGNALVTPEQESAQRLSQSHAILQAATQEIDRRSLKPVPRKRYLMRYLSMKALHWFGKAHYITPKQFCTTGRCVGCGKCVRVCPTQNIALNAAGNPQWGGQCARCLACFHWCPQNAITSKGKALRRKQYHHPDVTFREVAVSNDPCQDAPTHSR